MIWKKKNTHQVIEIDATSEANVETQTNAVEPADHIRKKKTRGFKKSAKQTSWAIALEIGDQRFIFSIRDEKCIRETEMPEESSILRASSYDLGVSMEVRGEQLQQQLDRTLMEHDLYSAVYRRYGNRIYFTDKGHATENGASVIPMAALLEIYATQGPVTLPAVFGVKLLVDDPSVSGGQWEPLIMWAILKDGTFGPPETRVEHHTTTDEIDTLTREVAERARITEGFERIILTHDAVMQMLVSQNAQLLRPYPQEPEFYGVPVSAIARMGLMVTYGLTAAVVAWSAQEWHAMSAERLSLQIAQQRLARTAPIIRWDRDHVDGVAHQKEIKWRDMIASAQYAWHPGVEVAAYTSTIPGLPQSRDAGGNKIVVIIPPHQTNLLNGGAQWIQSDQLKAVLQQSPPPGYHRTAIFVGANGGNDEVVYER